MVFNTNFHRAIKQMSRYSLKLYTFENEIRFKTKHVQLREMVMPKSGIRTTFSWGQNHIHLTEGKLNRPNKAYY